MSAVPGRPKHARTVAREGEGTPVSDARTHGVHGQTDVTGSARRYRLMRPGR